MKSRAYRPGHVTRHIIRDNMTLQTYSNIFWQGELLPQPPDTECGGGGVVGGVWLHHGDPQLGAAGEVVRGGGAHDAAPHGGEHAHLEAGEGDDRGPEARGHEQCPGNGNLL